MKGELAIAMKTVIIVIGLQGLVGSCSSVSSCRKVGCILHQRENVKCDVSQIIAKFKCDSISLHIDDDLPNGFNFTTSDSRRYYGYHESKMTVYYEYFNCTSKPVEVNPLGCSIPSEQLQIAGQSNTLKYQISGKTEDCMWRFPYASDEDALFLSVDFNTTDCSSGSLDIRGTGFGYNNMITYAGTCRDNSMKCIMYQKKSSNCDHSQLKRTFECRPLSVLIVERLPRSFYLRRNRASKVTMKLHYEYLKCPTGRTGPDIVPTTAESFSSPTSFSVEGRVSCPSEGFQLRKQSGNIAHEYLYTGRRYHPETCQWRFQNDSETMKHDALFLNVEETNMTDRDTCRGTMSGLVDSCSSVTSCRKVGCILHQRKDVKCDVSKIMAKLKCDAISWYIDDDLPNGFNFTTSDSRRYHGYHKSKMTVYYEYFNCTWKTMEVNSLGCSIPSEQLQIAGQSNTLTYQISGKTEDCTWRFPDASDEDALFLSVDFNTTDCSSGSLNIRDTGFGDNNIVTYAGTCRNNSMKCIMYQKQSSNCDQSQFKRKYECTLLSVLIVERLPRSIYLRRNRASKVTMKLHYEYLKCPTGRTGPDIVPTTAAFFSSPTSFSVLKQPVGHSASEGTGFKLDVTSFFIGFVTIFCISAVIVTGLALKLRSDKNNTPAQREASIGARSAHENVLGGHQGIQAEESYYGNVPGSVCPNPALPEDGEGYLTPIQLQNLRVRDVHGGS